MIQVAMIVHKKKTSLISLSDYFFISDDNPKFMTERLKEYSEAKSDNREVVYC